MVVIDDVAEMTKEMWAYLDTVVKGKVMDIVDDLRKDPYEEERQYKREARLELGNMLDKAADEIEQLRNAIKVQANAVRVLHEAETSELNLLRKNAQEAYTAKATLDSEREANKILTDEIERLRGVLQQITELSPFKSNTGNASIQYITQMLVKMTALAHEALKEKE